MMKWICTNGMYTSSETLYLGNCPVGRVTYDGITPQETTERYIAVCLLPGVSKRGRLGRFTATEAKATVELAVRGWLVEAGLEQAK